MENLSRGHVKRTRLLINRSFQLRYMGVFVLSALLAAGVIGGSLYVVLEMNWILEVEKGLHLLPETKLLLSQSKGVILGTGAGLFLVLSLILSLWGLFLSHRVAGPVYALSRFLDQMTAEKKLDRELHFRKKDALQEVSQAMNQTLNFLRVRCEEEKEQLSEIGEDLLMLEKKNEGYPSLHALYRQVGAFKKDKEKWLRNGL